MFSIIIPLYNKELSIFNTIESVLNQTFTNFEILVINDGSTDNSAKIVETICDSRIRLIHQTNQGVSAARNFGIKEASNEWIAFLDGDDLWKSNHLEEITRMMFLFPNKKVYVTSFAFSDNKKMFIHPRQNSIFKIENYFKEALFEYLICTDTIVINRYCFDKVGTFNIKLNRGEDVDLWARLASEYDIIKSSSVTAVYRVEAENRTSLSKYIESTSVYNFDLSLRPGTDENYYYKTLILRRLYEYLRSMSLGNVFKLKRKHPEIAYSEFFLFTLNCVGKRIKNKML